MATYTINVVNKSGVAKSYIVFMDPPPQLGSTGGDPVVYTNPWATFPTGVDSSWDTVHYADTTDVDRRRGHDPLPTGTIVDDVTAADSSLGDSVVFSAGPPAGFVAVTPPGAAPGGEFRIVGSGEPTLRNGYAFDLAHASAGPAPPVATFAAEPNVVYNITPVERFYVAEGLYASGQRIPTSEASKSAAKIDFTGTAYQTATVTEDADGNWNVSYS